MERSEKPAAIILSVLGRVGGRFPDDTVRIVGELVSHNEVGIALETLCSQVFEYELDLSEEDQARLKEAASLLGISHTQLDGLGG